MSIIHPIRQKFEYSINSMHFYLTGGKARRYQG